MFTLATQHLSRCWLDEKAAIAVLGMKCLFYDPVLVTRALWAGFLLCIGRNFTCSHYLQGYFAERRLYALHPFFH